MKKTKTVRIAAAVIAFVCVFSASACGTATVEEAIASAVGATEKISAAATEKTTEAQSKSEPGTTAETSKATESTTAESTSEEETTKTAKANETPTMQTKETSAATIKETTAGNASSESTTKNTEEETTGKAAEKTTKKTTEETTTSPSKTEKTTEPATEKATEAEKGSSRPIGTYTIVEWETEPETEPATKKKTEKETACAHRFTTIDLEWVDDVITQEYTHDVVTEVIPYGYQCKTCGAVFDYSTEEGHEACKQHYCGGSWLNIYDYPIAWETVTETEVVSEGYYIEYLICEECNQVLDSFVHDREWNIWNDNHFER